MDLCDHDICWCVKFVRERAPRKNKLFLPGCMGGGGLNDCESRSETLYKYAFLLSEVLWVSDVLTMS